MKTSREKAEEFYLTIPLGYDAKTVIMSIADFIKQDRAEQREACGEEAYLMARDLDVSGMVSKRIEQACLNAGVKE